MEKLIFSDETENLPVTENIDEARDSSARLVHFFQSFFRKTATVEELVKLCRLTEFLDQYNDKISGGQRQRFLLALALINRPELLFLDEPSTGKNPQARRNL